MEKIKLNTQIVCMRKYVKQAKVHVVNKLVKEIKLLQNRKGSEAKILKAKRKAERCLDAVTIVKKTKPDDVTKLALLKAKDWKAVLQEKNSSLHDRCIAMLANYGAVQKEIETFYSANKELVLNISNYITEWEQKNKMPKNVSKANKVSPEKKTNKKFQKSNSKDESNKKEKFKAIVETRIESDIEKKSSGIKIQSKDVNIHLKAQDSESNADNEYKISNIQKLNNHSNNINDTEKSEDLHSDENNSLKDDDSESSNEESESDENDNEEEMMDFTNNNNNNDEIKDCSDEDNNMDNAYKSKLKTDSLHKVNNHSKNNLKAIALLNLNELEGLDEIPVSHSVKNDESDEKESSEDEVNETYKNKSCDPFFLSHNKEDSNAKELDSFSNDSNVQFRSVDTPHSYNNRTKFVKNRDFQKKDTQFISKKFEFNHRNDERTFKRKKFTSQSFDNKFSERNKNKRDFKLKNKPYSPINMPGKNETKNNSKSYENKGNTPLKNKETYKKGKNASEVLHPSWEAKKKQKELLNTSFQGKRMVFND